MRVDTMIKSVMMKRSILAMVLGGVMVGAQVGALAMYAKPCAADVKATTAHNAIQYMNINDAVQRGMNQQKVTVIVFGAEWCTWCKKMKSVTLQDPQVLALAGSYVWSYVDIDQQPRVAAMIGIRGVPALAVVNAKGEILTVKSGYLPVSSMVKLLEEYKDKPFAKGELEKRVLEVLGVMKGLDNSLSHKEFDIATVKLVEVLGGTDLRGRKEMVMQVQVSGENTWPALVKLLSSKRLATRGVAIDLLREMTKADIAFDPFADESVRAAQIKDWEKFLQDNGLRLSNADVNAIEKELDRAEEKAKQLKEAEQETGAPAAPI